MIDFCILGSGIAGSTIANLLSKKYSVEVFDKARGPGGRCSNKRLESNLNFDHGTQYFSPKTKKFKNFILNLKKKNIIKTWDGNHLDLTFKKGNSVKYIGKKANNDICKYLLKKVKKSYFSPISKINYKKNFWEITLKDESKIFSKALIISCPYPQLKKIAKKNLNKKMLNLKIRMEPNITAMLAFKNQKNLDISSIKFNDDILAWAANENSKNRFKTSINLWTLQSTIKWARKNINFERNNDKVLNQLIKRFLKLTNFNKNKIYFKKIHNWKYSYNLNKSSIKSYWNNKYNLGVCGDWFIGPKAEDAWLSAVDLYSRQKKTPFK